MTKPTRTVADAWHLSRNGQFDAALDLATELVGREPDNANAIHLLATLVQQHGEHQRAVALFERALTLSGPSAAALVALAEAQRLAGDPAAALDNFAQALSVQPRDTAALRGLAQCHHELGDHAGALAAFSAVQAILPYDKYAAHMVAVLTDGTPSHAYVADLFDAHAEDFDTQLVDVLHYDIPNRIADLVRPHAPSTVLDLGCGTGLVAAALTGTAPVIDGVDLSPQMVRKAATRGLYRHLRIGDLLDVIRHDADLTGPYDLVTAADVFVYLGPLDAIFAAVSALLSPGGVFAFSIETAGDSDVVLRSSGRFAHSPAYIERLAATNGLTTLTAHDTPIREERSQPIPGRLHLLQR